MNRLPVQESVLRPDGLGSSPAVNLFPEWKLNYSYLIHELRLFSLGMLVGSAIFVLVFRLLFSFYDQVFIALKGLLVVLWLILMLYFLPKLYLISASTFTSVSSERSLSALWNVMRMLFKAIACLSLYPTLSLFPLLLLLPLTRVPIDRLDPNIWFAWWARFLIILLVFFAYLLVTLNAGFLLHSIVRLRFVYSLVVCFFALSTLSVGKVAFGYFVWELLRVFGLSFFSVQNQFTLGFYGLSNSLEDFTGGLATFGLSPREFQPILYILVGCLSISALVLHLSAFGNNLRRRFFLPVKSKFTALESVIRWLLPSCIAFLGFFTVLLLFRGSSITAELGDARMAGGSNEIALFVLIAISLMALLVSAIASAVFPQIQSRLVTFPRGRYFRVIYISGLYTCFSLFACSLFLLFTLGVVVQGISLEEYLACAWLLLLFSLLLPFLSGCVVFILRLPQLLRFRYLASGLVTAIAVEFLLFFFLLPVRAELLLGGLVDVGDAPSLDRLYSELRLLDAMSYWQNFSGFLKLFSITSLSGLERGLIITAASSLLVIPILLSYLAARISRRLA